MHISTEYICVIAVHLCRALAESVLAGAGKISRCGWLTGKMPALAELVLAVRTGKMPALAELVPAVRTGKMPALAESLPAVRTSN